jgi:hypothetical protein
MHITSLARTFVNSLRLHADHSDFDRFLVEYTTGRAIIRAIIRAELLLKRAQTGIIE